MEDGTDATTATDVRDTYDRIADHFSSTRHHAWPETEEFCATHDGDRGIDIGCGNGRHTEVLCECVDHAVGLDVSPRLLDIAADRVPAAGFVTGDAARLPFAANQFDIAIYVATLHHLPTQAMRRQSLAELSRVLTEDGVALISAWSTDADRFDAGTGFDTFVDWTLPDGETVDRFYHIYDQTEFETDLRSQLEIRRSWLSSGNCYGVVAPRRRS
ncbi:MAG: class I SAM-dependent methyltransferase [Natronomonas sp.]